ncbi:MAG: (Fe-S)-binding protein [Acidimicrobiia bacterium]
MEDELVACVSCGLCLPHCPTYRVTGFEFASPRGRIAAMRAVEFDAAPIDAEFGTAMDECVQCRGCETACPSGVQFGHLMEGARAALQRNPPPEESRAAAAGQRARRTAEWLAYVVVLPRHGVLLALTWVAWLAQRLHLVPRRFGLPRLTRASLRTPLVADAHADTFLFTGCVMDAWQRDVHRAALQVMRATGARVGLPGPGGACCGALHVHAGRVKQARRLARRVIRSLPAAGAVVVGSAGCGAAMKHYGELLDTDDARAFSARVFDFSEWVAAQPSLPLHHSDQPVVIQDPCHLRHVQHAENAVHTLLSRGYPCRPVDDEGLCCGAGGAYAVWQPRLAGLIRDRKVAAIRNAATGTGAAPLVASANPGCAMHLGAGGLDVRHPAELLADLLLEERLVTDSEASKGPDHRA